ncbi:MAG: NAD-dependent epimerase/dehydratase family protein [Anaerolineae bacterium]|nr:NAD-dependent epimerase/dehydratase family protein [Anaerolineae bacterium]
MTREPIVLITGANGEVGHGLIKYLSQQAHVPEIVAFDLKPLDEALRPLVKRYLVGDILDNALLESLHQDYEIDTIYHLAALLSTSAEKFPELAHNVNVQGTVQLLHMAMREGKSRQKAVKFIYPSSIAVYGLPDLQTKAQAGAVAENDYLFPTTMYGCNKLYTEHLGRYYTNHYQQLSDMPSVGLDFRCLRFPGLISAFTVPSGGTSDYAPEMIHAAAKGEAYTCFVREDTAIPFMAMPDGIQALIQLAEAPRETLNSQVYNVTGFSATAAEIATLVQAEFPNAQISYEASAGRQGIVDTWAADVDDSRARKDWHWRPAYDIQRTFADYLFPNIRERYTETML